MKSRNVQRKNKKKSRKFVSKDNYSQSQIVCMFLRMLNTVKLYHWKTSSFAQHKATDELYSNLNTNIDSFVEIMLGKTGGRVSFHNSTLPLLDYSNVLGFTKELEMYKKYLINMRLNDSVDSDLLNIRDEILGNLNQVTYLLTFK